MICPVYYVYYHFIRDDDDEDGEDEERESVCVCVCVCVYVSGCGRVCECASYVAGGINISSHVIR